MLFDFENKNTDVWCCRNICIIPTSAHGTNPASAVMCGMTVVIVKTLANGAVDMEDFKAAIAKHKDNLAAFMITYPSTYGVFDDDIREVRALYIMSTDAMRR